MLILSFSQRAGDYVIEWAQKIKAHSKQVSGGTGGTTSTLVKRGAKPEGADEHPSKRPKLEPGSSGVEEEVKRSFNKGAVAKVSITVFQACGFLGI